MNSEYWSKVVLIWFKLQKSPKNTQTLPPDNDVKLSKIFKTCCDTVYFDIFPHYFYFIKKLLFGHEYVSCDIMITCWTRIRKL